MALALVGITPAEHDGAEVGERRRLALPVAVPTRQLDRRREVRCGAVAVVGK